MKNFTLQTPRIYTLKILLIAVVCLTASVNARATATIDTTFSTNGRVTLAKGSERRINAIALQSDDKIVAVGGVDSNSQSDGLVLRHNANGTLDQSFGNGGEVILPITSSSEYFYDATIQPNGKIVIVGSVAPLTGSAVTDFLIVRLNPNGSLDNSFGSGGIITVNQDSEDSLRAVKIQPDGKIVAVGGTSDAGGRGAVFRLNPNGSFDASFGGGLVLIDAPQPTNELFTSLDFYPNGQILVGGEVRYGNGPGSRVGMVALLAANGALVQNFGNNSFVNTELTSYTSQTLVKVLPNGNFIAGSFPNIYTNNGLYVSPFVARTISGVDFLSNGNSVILSRQDSALNFNGIRILNKNLRLVGSDEKDLGISEFSGTALEVQSDDKIVIFRDGVLVRLIGVTSNATRIANFDDPVIDLKTDIAVYRPSNRTFYLSLSTNSFRSYQTTGTPAQIIPERFYRASFPVSFAYWQVNMQDGAFGYFKGANNDAAISQWGVSGDVPVGGDYDGDNLTDFAVFRPSNGTWYISQSSNNQFLAYQFGQAGDKLVPADYDYDGITDFAVFRPSNGAWYISRSSDGGFVGAQFGQNGDVPITGDFDGDGRADLTVYRPSNGVWYSMKSREGFSAVAFGIATDQPVPGDYDGDGRHDPAVFRAGVWYILGSRNGFRAVQWGLPDDIPLSVRY